MRCLLEQVAGASKIGNDEKVNNLFGITEDKETKRKNRPSKLIVRDAMLSEESKKELLACDSLDMPFTENKWENVIDRINGKAEHPRQTERVPAGAVFNAEFILNIWNGDDEKEMMELFEKGIHLLENDYLGGSGSRGYGQIKFGKLDNKTILSEENNWKA